MSTRPESPDFVPNLSHPVPKKFFPWVYQGDDPDLPSALIASEKVVWINAIDTLEENIYKEGKLSVYDMGTLLGLGQHVLAWVFKCHGLENLRRWERLAGDAINAEKANDDWNEIIETFRATANKIIMDGEWGEENLRLQSAVRCGIFDEETFEKIRKLGYDLLEHQKNIRPIQFEYFGAIMTGVQQAGEMESLQMDENAYDELQALRLKAVREKGGDSS